MATRDEQDTPRWKEICALTMIIHQFASEQAAHTSPSRENLESIKRYAVAVVDCLDQTNRDEPTFLPAFASISFTDQSTSPPSPIALSPSSSPRIPLRDIKESASLMDMSGDRDARVYLPPINICSHYAQPLHAPSYPMVHQSTPRRTSQHLGEVPGSKRDARTFVHQPGAFTSFNMPRAPTLNAFNQSSASSPPRPPTTFVAHSFNETPSYPQASPPHPTPPNLHIPRGPAGTTSSKPMAIVITQPLATICEIPGFKRRGRPSTKIDNQCVECGTNRTPEWRRGEGGAHLCNACGLQYSKRVRREKAEKKRNAITAVLNNDDI